MPLLLINTPNNTAFPVSIVEVSGGSTYFQQPWETRDLAEIALDMYENQPSLYQRIKQSYRDRKEFVALLKSNK